MKSTVFPVMENRAKAASDPTLLMMYGFMEIATARYFML